MPFKEFLKLIGITDYKVKGEWNKNPNDILNLNVDGPYVDEWGNMICSIQIPDELWKVLNKN